MIGWMMDKYNKVVTDIKSNLPDKATWLVQVRLTDSSEIVLEYKAHSIQHVKSRYKSDLTVYNGLLVGSGASKRYVKKKDIDRVLDIILVDSSNDSEAVSEGESEDVEEE